MIELWLEYKDENGDAKRVLVEGERFAIGRTPDNDLQFPLGSLSRQHAQIQRFADVFMLVDLDSSNGTKLNGERLSDPKAIQKGDTIILGDVFEITADFVSDEPESGSGGGGSDDDGDDGSEDESDSSPASKSATQTASGSSFAIFLLVPIFVLFILGILGIAVFFWGKPKDGDIVKNNQDYEYKDDFEGDSDKPETKKTATPEDTKTPVVSNSPNGGTGTPSPTVTDSSTPVSTETPSSDKPASNDSEKIEIASASFLRRIAQNDPTAFLTGQQIAIVSPKIDQFRNSRSLAENIKNAKKSASKIQSLAASQNLKPQFLANAALAKLGNQTGDVGAAAESIAAGLAAISRPFGNEFADENLLVIAAYEGNTSGESLQTTAGIFTKNSQTNARTIRSIWFFKENGKLSPQQFEFALRFLAIGTITQNPKDFNVQAEALVF